MSLRDDILSYDDTVYRSVTVPEWGGKVVWLRTPSSVDRDAFEASMIVKRTEKRGGKKRTVQETSLANIRAKLVVRCACEGEGKAALIFKPEDADVLANKSAAAVDRLFAVAQELAGINEEDIEELAGN